jgi:hypothetical protein
MMVKSEYRTSKSASIEEWNWLAMTRPMAENGVK